MINTRRRATALIVVLLGAGLVYVLASVLVYWNSGTRMLPYERAEPGKPPADTEWPQYGKTASGERWSGLDQINRGNVRRLEVAWVYQAGELDAILAGEQPFNPWESTPVLVEDTLVACTPTGRLLALDPVTGEERWTFDPGVVFSPFGHTFVKCRGVSTYVDNSAEADAICRTRLLWGTGDLRAFAVDARTGRRCPDFGADDGTPGEVQLDPGPNLQFHDEVQIHAPPAMAGHVAVFGSTLADNLQVRAPSGMVRALDARSGELLWIFDPVPRDGGPAAATWGPEGAGPVGAGNAWSLLSADPENGLVFVPTTSPSVDLVGNYRPGENLYTDSLVALDSSTGEVRWHFQIVHHDLWDYDLPAQPILTDFEREGERVPAVVQLTKQGMVFVFNRLTGEPLVPIEERPVPQTTDIRGEWLSPTQPFTKKLGLVAQGMRPEDAWGFTFWDRNHCRRQIEDLRSEGMYTPPSTQGTIVFPSSAGGMNWGGGAVVPESGILITPTLHMAQVHRLVPRDQVNPDDQGSGSHLFFPMGGTDYVMELYFLTSPLGAPCTEPPWARLSAVDLVAGKVLWQVPLGSIAQLAASRIGLPLPLEMGTPMAGGPIVTAGGLAFIAATADDRIRAFDIETGQKLWEAELPAGGQSTPMTYAAGGRQYLVIMAGGHPYYGTTKGDHLIAFALPD
ncbi:MAG: pyrroloquinoline quinone-dependent dehydrogenase [Proteobacteria bacterium]|nr:pyrroloquinoline quinone-dependent dehydrogenase [Pseudomonadota bacterium]